MLGDDPARRPRRGTVDLARFLRYCGAATPARRASAASAFEVEAEAGLPAGLRVDLVSLARIARTTWSATRSSSRESGTVRLSVVRDPDGGVVFRVTDEGRACARADVSRRRPGPDRQPAHGPRARTSSGALPTGSAARCISPTVRRGGAVASVRSAGGGRRRRRAAATDVRPPTSPACASCSPRTIRPTRWSPRRCCAR